MSQFPAIINFHFPTPTNIPNIYGEDLTVMNIFVEIPNQWTLSTRPSDGMAFILEVQNKVKVSAEIY